MTTKPSTLRRSSPKQTIARQLNWLKAQIINQYYSEINLIYRLDTIGYPNPSWLTEAYKETARTKAHSRLIQLQNAADKHGVRGNYRTVLPFAETKEGKRAAKLAKQSQQAVADYEEAKEDPAALAKIVDRSLSEKSGT
jgi:hypothetical protein